MYYFFSHEDICHLADLNSDGPPVNAIEKALSNLNFRNEPVREPSTKCKITSLLLNNIIIFVNCLAVDCFYQFVWSELFIQNDFYYFRLQQCVLSYVKWKWRYMKRKENRTIMKMNNFFIHTFHTWLYYFVPATFSCTEPKSPFHYC